MSKKPTDAAPLPLCQLPMDPAPAHLAREIAALQTEGSEGSTGRQEEPMDHDTMPLGGLTGAARAAAEQEEIQQFQADTGIPSEQDDQSSNVPIGDGGTGPDGEGDSHDAGEKDGMTKASGMKPDGGGPTGEGR